MTVWQNISTITGSTRAPFAVRASIGFVFWLLASAFCFGQGYSYTSTYVWISDGEVYATSTTDSNYGSGSHDAWASTRISSPSGRSVYVDTGFTGQYASAWTHLSTQDEIGDFVAEGGHQEWCYIAQALITLSITRQVIKNPTCPIPTGEITQAGSWEDGAGQPGLLDWYQTLQGGVFTSRAVMEQDPGGGTDTCYSQGSPIPWSGRISGGYWTANPGNAWGPDAVGWALDAILHYRRTGKAPCSAIFDQLMLIECNGRWYQYRRNTLQANLGVITLSSERAGQYQVRTYPTQ